jgi:hypothetical protein
VWQETKAAQADPAIEAELEQLKNRLAQGAASPRPEAPQRQDESPA